MAKTKSAYIGRGKLMFGFIFIFTFLVSLISFSPSIYALTFSRDVTVSFTFDSTIGLTLSSDLYIYNLAPGSSSDSNIITVSILTNNITGYTLNATVGDTTFNNRDLTHIADSTQKFSSINYGSSLASLSTDNTWGYSYSLNNGSTWTNYSGLPLYSDTSNVAVLKTSTGAASSWSGDAVKFKIAAKAATTQPSGVYRNVINFNVVANVVPQYTIQFNANTGSGSMPNQVIFRDTATKLATNQFSAPAGYVFAGWNTAANGSGTAYTDQQSVTNLAADGATLTLYAQWEVDCNSSATTIADARCLQDFAHVSSANRASIIASMTPETQYTLRDSRDGKEYTIAKFQVGTNDYDVWMTQNLDLDLDSSVTYTNEDTDIGYNTSTGTYGTASWTPTRSTYAPSSTNTATWCNGGTWSSRWGCDINTTPESYDPGDLYWNGAIMGSSYTPWTTYWDSCDKSTNTMTCNESLNPFSTYTASTGTAQYHLGNYYNWNAAVAMNDSSSYNRVQVLIEQSICPAGWTLPREGRSEDTIYALWNQYGLYSVPTNSNNWWSAPLYFVPAGTWDGAFNLTGYAGRLWPPMTSSGDEISYPSAAWYFDAYSRPSSVYLSRGSGGTIRCVARPVASSFSW